MESKQEQINFVNSLCEAIRADIVKSIESGKIPENWDGIEFRWLVEERSKTNFGNVTKKRKADFNNTVIVNNL